MRDIDPRTSLADRLRYAQALSVAIGEYLEDDGPDLPEPDELRKIAERVAHEQGIELVTVQ